jgi:hypothetical protein
MGCLKYIYLHVNIINLENLKVCSILGYYDAKRKFFLDFLTLEDGADRLIRNVGKDLPLSQRSADRARSLEFLHKQCYVF